MLTGGATLVPESLFEIPGFCTKDVHDQYFRILTKGVVMLGTAKAMDNKTIPEHILDRFEQTFKRAETTYVCNCGCPKGFKKVKNDTDWTCEQLHSGKHTFRE